MRRCQFVYHVEGNVRAHNFAAGELASSHGLVVNQLPGQGTVVTIYDGAGRRHEHEPSPLSRIIENLNERFGLKLTEADRLHLDGIAQDLVDDETVQRQAAANSMGNFGVQFPQHFQTAVADRLASAEDFSFQLLDNTDLSEQAMNAYLPLVYGKARVAWQEPCPIGELLGPPPKEGAHLEYKSTFRARIRESSTSRFRRPPSRPSPRS